MLSRPLTTARGENTSAAWGVVNFLMRLTASHRPDYVAWIHDSGRSFRHDILPAYKATREKLSEELQADFDAGLRRIEELLAAYHIATVTVDGFEADDVIGTLAQQARRRGLNVVIVSGDKDFHQCIEPGVWLLNPGRGGPAGVDEQFVSVENAMQRLGVPPERTTDYLALVGDSSDNVPGVPGVGDKTARELIEEYGDLTSILASTNEIPKKRPREALQKFSEQALLSKVLVTIQTNVPIELELERCRVRAPDISRLRQLFVELEFSTLLKTLDDVQTVPSAETHAHYSIVDSVGSLSSLVARLRQQTTFALTTVSAPGPDSPDEAAPIRSRLAGLALAIVPGEVFYLPFAHRLQHTRQGDLLGESTGDAHAKENEPKNLPGLRDPAMRDLVAVLEEPRIAKVAHDAKRDAAILRGAGVALNGLQFDTMLASYVLDPGRRSHDLTLLALEFLDRNLMTEEALCGRGKDRVALDLLRPITVMPYACGRADALLRLRETLTMQLAEHGLMELFENVELPLINVLMRMEITGIAIDLNWFRSLKQRFQRERARVEGEIFDVAGERFNINSNQQLRTILFEKLHLPVKKRTATGASTDATVLQELADEGHTLPVLLMEYRELAKLESTYLDALPRLVDRTDGRLHTTFNQTVAATGRLSSSDPNLQNIPIRRELGRDIRRGFVARSGWMLLAADYSQIELRVLAHLSHDAAFVDAFSRGGDIHRETAAIIFAVSPADVTSEMRARAKTINFATIYGQGPVALARQLKIPVAEARAFIATYFDRFRGVREYLDSRVAFAREHGYVETIFHRRRYIPELKDRNFNIRSFGERVATNAPIQGSAADLIKIAMIRIDQRIEKERLESRMLLQVHDELVLEMAPDEAQRVQGLVKHEMEHAAELSVPLVVDLGVGANWLETKDGR
ncbi:MAG: DNA polymerase I [Gemmatimonadaceae bacterium]|nr:DNA polymerase I [Gemmatimonadaceae bacterium]